jgi:hypothetical protein
MSRRPALIAAGIALAAASGVWSGSTAQAATPRDGNCESHEVCLYWSSNFMGPMYDHSGDVTNYQGHNFPGYNIPVNDNTMSVLNKANWMDVRLCTDTWWRGSCVVVAPGNSISRLENHLANQLSSHEWWS